MASARPAVGHALIVDLGHAPEPGDQAPCCAVLADHLARRALTVDVLSVPVAPPHRPELVVGFVPDLASAETAGRIALATGARLIVVVQELLRGADPLAGGIPGLGARNGAAGTPAAEHARLALRRREEALLRSACFVAIASETFREAVRDYGVPDSRIGVLPDWAHVVPTWLDRQDARRALGWPQRGFIAVHTGMGPHHDPGTVIEAARLAGPEVTVVLAGDGIRRDEVRAAAAEVPNVLVTGMLDAERRPLSLVAADVVVLSEHLEPGELVMPGELGSCLAAARPVVAAAHPGGVAQAELARADGACVVVPAGSPEHLAEALLALRADPARRVAMGLAGLAHAEGHLDVRRALARFDAILDAALTGPAAVPAEHLAVAGG